MKYVTYRGEHGKRDSSVKFQSRGKAISFGSFNAANAYASNPNNRNDLVVDPRVFKAEITINNPVINQRSDPFIEGKDLAKALGEDKAIKILKDNIDYLRNTDNWITFCDERVGEDGDDKEFLDLLASTNPNELLSEVYMDAYPIFDNDEYVQWFIEAGFDGVIHGGNGETALEAEYKIFDPEQGMILKDIELKDDVDSEMAI